MQTNSVYTIAVFFIFMYINSKNARWNDGRALRIVSNVSPNSPKRVEILAQSGFSSKCCRVACLIGLLYLQEIIGQPLLSFDRTFYSLLFDPQHGIYFLA